MWQIITKIPIFIWPLFVILLVGGLRARKRNIIPLYIPILIPSIFFIWSVISFFGKYSDLTTAFLWILFLGIGFFIGFSHMQRLELHFDSHKKIVEMPGSWIPLMLSMSIFFLKFSICMSESLHPGLKGSNLLLILELFSVVILGIFAGRGIACIMRYRAAMKAA